MKNRQSKRIWTGLKTSDASKHLECFEANVVLQSTGQPCPSRKQNYHIKQPRHFRKRHTYMLPNLIRYPSVMNEGAQVSHASGDCCSILAALIPCIESVIYVRTQTSYTLLTIMTPETTWDDTLAQWPHLRRLSQDSNEPQSPQRPPTLAACFPNKGARLKSTHQDPDPALRIQSAHLLGNSMGVSVSREGPS